VIKIKGNPSLPNYYEVPIPMDKPKSDWNYNERRAFILRRIIEVGDPQLISRTKISNLFDVSQQQISKDINKISKSINQHIDESKLKMEIETAFRTIKHKAIEQDDYNLYRKAVNDWKDWMFQSGHLDREPEKIKHEGIGEITVIFEDIEEDEMDD